MAAALEPHLSPTSFSYRPGRSTFDAACAVAEAVSTEPQGQLYFIRADVARCFGSLSWKVLKRELRKHFADGRLRRLVLGLVQRPIVVGRELHHPRSGIPQGAAISPVLSNMYLASVDSVLETRARQGFAWVRYSDDFLCVAPGDHESAKFELAFLERELKRVRLELAAEKTFIGPVSDGVDFIGLRFRRDVNDSGTCDVTVAQRNAFRLSDILRELVTDSLEAESSPPAFVQALSNVLIGWTSAFCLASDAEDIAERCGHQSLMDWLAGDPRLPSDEIEKRARILGRSLWGRSGSP